MHAYAFIRIHHLIRVPTGTTRWPDMLVPHMLSHMPQISAQMDQTAVLDMQVHLPTRMSCRSRLLRHLQRIMSPAFPTQLFIHPLWVRTMVELYIHVSPTRKLARHNIIFDRGPYHACTAEANMKVAYCTILFTVTSLFTCGCSCWYYLYANWRHPCTKCEHVKPEWVRNRKALACMSTVTIDDN